MEAIDIIEEAIKHSPDSVTGFLQGQTLKYLLRIWHKDSSLEDVSKALWYLNRLAAAIKAHKIEGDNLVKEIRRERLDRERDAFSSGTK